MYLIVWISTTHKSEEQSQNEKDNIELSYLLPRFTKFQSSTGGDDMEDETLLSDKRETVVHPLCILFVTCPVFHVTLCGPVIAVSS